MKVTPKQKHLLQSLVLLGEIDRLNPFGIFGEEEEKSWAGASRHRRDILESSRWIRALTGARIYTRGKGEASLRKETNFQRDLEFLQRKLNETKTRMNPDLAEHLARQLEEILR